MILDGDEFARACYNAHAFLPARCPYKTALLRTGAGFLEITATDGYAAGRSRMESKTITAAPASVEIARDDLLLLDKAGRAAKGDMDVFIKAGDGIVVSYPYGGAETVSIMDQAARDPDLTELWDACDDLLMALEELPQRIAFDPSILMRFGKVKTPKGTSPMLDLAFAVNDEPVMAKVGPGFVGAIMPVYRDVAAQAAARGGDFLW